MAEPIIQPDTHPNRSLVTPRELFDSYTVSTRSYDEVFTAPGDVRPHWENVIPFLDALGSDGLARRWDQARRLIH